VGEQVREERSGSGAAPGGRGAGGPQADLASAFDLRLADVWLQVFRSGIDVSDLSEYVACFLRMAYLRGYEDGLCEEERGSLFSSLGLPVPRRRGAGGRDRKGRSA
jgi:hypothetical protein